MTLLAIEPRRAESELVPGPVQRTARDATTSMKLSTYEDETVRALKRLLSVDTFVSDMTDARAFMVTPILSTGAVRLVVSKHTTVAERLHVYLHMAAHLLIEPLRPLSVYVESASSRGGCTSDHDADTHKRAEDLASRIWWGLTQQGCDSRTHETDSTCWASTGDALLCARLLSALLPGQRYQFLRGLLGKGAARRLVRSALIAVRRSYYESSLHDRLRPPFAFETFRQVLCVTEVVEAAPQLSQLRHR